MKTFIFVALMFLSIQVMAGGDWYEKGNGTDYTVVYCQGQEVIATTEVEYIYLKNLGCTDSPNNKVGGNGTSKPSSEEKTL